jgi:hypothetical protein
VGEKFLMNRYHKRLDVAGRDQGTGQRYGSCFWCSAQVRRLANLARRFVLSVGVRVRNSLRYKQNGQDRQGQRKNPEPVTSRLASIAHLGVITHYPNPPLDARAFA